MRQDNALSVEVRQATKKQYRSGLFSDDCPYLVVGARRGGVVVTGVSGKFALHTPSPNFGTEAYHGVSSPCGSATSTVAYDQDGSPVVCALDPPRKRRN